MAPSLIQQQSTIRVLRIKQLAEKIGLGVSTIYARLDPKDKSYDPSFPHPISLGAKAIGFYEADADAWLLSRGGPAYAFPLPTRKVPS